MFLLSNYISYRREWADKNEKFIRKEKDNKKYEKNTSRQLAVEHRDKIRMRVIVIIRCFIFEYRVDTEFISV